MTTTETGSTELLPCPFCGSADINTEGPCYDAFMCNGCGASQYDQPGHSEAIAAWNTRALRNAQSEAVAVKAPEKWMLEPAAIYLEMVDDDETGSNVVVANYLRSLAALTHPAPPLAGTDEMVEAKKGIYVASKVAHAELWRDLRHWENDPIISTWIDEAGVGESASLEDLWRRCVTEAATAGALIIYRCPGEVLKGAWVELGAALASGVPVFAVGIEEFTVANHVGITHCRDLIEARRLARAALTAALEAKQ